MVVNSIWQLLILKVTHYESGFDSEVTDRKGVATMKMLKIDMLERVTVRM
jgi:hypothetical protein